MNEIDKLIRDQEEDDKATFYEHAIFKAPWRERLPSSDERPRYGPWYLPRSPVTGSAVTQDVAMAQYHEGRYVGSSGLWDHEQDTPRAVRKQNTTRYDYEAMTSYVNRYSHGIAKKELEVYFAYWIEGRSLKKTAYHVGISENTVQALIGRLRKRVKDGKAPSKGYYQRRVGR